MGQRGNHIFVWLDTQKFFFSFYTEIKHYTEDIEVFYKIKKILFFLVIFFQLYQMRNPLINLSYRKYPLNRKSYLREIFRVKGKVFNISNFFDIFLRVLLIILGIKKFYL